MNSINGFNVFYKDEAIQTFENRAGTFKLIAQDEALEIYESVINKGKSIIYQPYESADSLNMIYIIEGKLFHTNERKFLNAGDKITFKNLKETHHLSVVEASKLLTMRNSQHFIKQASTTDQVYKFIHEIQKKDQYTEEHCNATGNLAVQIATLLRLPEQVIEDVLHAGKIHDVGKLNISTSILNKPGKLTNEEFARIMEHSQLGYDIVLKITGNTTLAKIVLDHHERLDGSGYPNGLKGNQITIESRILAVADSFDAMTSNRLYQKALSPQDALADLRKHEKTWYDPSIIDVLDEIIHFSQ